MSTRSTYQWTTARRITAAAIVVAGAVFCTIMIVWFAERMNDLGPSIDDFNAAFDRTSLAFEQQGLAAFNTDDLCIPARDILPGGPPKDGIRALLDPATVAAEAVDFLDVQPRIVGVTVNGESRAYPISVLMRHEVINDTLGTLPIAVIYCPLCDSVSVVERRLDDTTYELAVSGLLVNSNVLMFDRGDDALWSQIGLESISGPNAGTALRHLPWEITPFDRWQLAHPGGTVVSYDTGATFNYDTLPYGDYFETDDLFVPMRPDRRLPIKEPVFGIRRGDVQRAIPVRHVRAQPERRLTVTIGDTAIVIEADDAGAIRVVTMPDDAQVIHTFWFAWAAFFPETEIVGREP